MHATVLIHRVMPHFLKRPYLDQPVRLQFLGMPLCSDIVSLLPHIPFHMTYCLLGHRAINITHNTVNDFPFSIAYEIQSRCQG